MKKEIVKANVDGDANIGLYGVTNDYLFFSPFYKSFNVNVLKILKVRAEVKLTIDEMPFLGMFVVVNNKGMVLPYMIKDKELTSLKKQLQEVNEGDMNLYKLEHKENALGNLMLCNDNGCVISSSLSKYSKIFYDILGVEVVKTGTIMGAEVIGSLGYATNEGFIISAYAEEEEYNLIKEVLKVDGDIGTVNYGSPFVASGIIANSKGALVGEHSTPIEIGRIAESLNLM